MRGRSKDKNDRRHLSAKSAPFYGGNQSFPGSSAPQTSAFISLGHMANLAAREFGEVCFDQQRQGSLVREKVIKNISSPTVVPGMHTGWILGGEALSPQVWLEPVVWVLSAAST